MVFQSYALYPHLDVAGNLAFPLRMRSRGQGRDPAQGERRRPELLGIERNLLGKKPGQLSGGQRQRVAIGRAIVRSAASCFSLTSPCPTWTPSSGAGCAWSWPALHRKPGGHHALRDPRPDRGPHPGARDRSVLDQGQVQQIGGPARDIPAPGQPLCGRLPGLSAHELFRGGYRSRGASSCAPRPAFGMSLSGPKCPPARPPWAYRPEELTPGGGRGLHGRLFGANRAGGRPECLAPQGLGRGPPSRPPPRPTSAAAVGSTPCPWTRHAASPHLFQGRSKRIN